MAMSTGYVLAAGPAYSPLVEAITGGEHKTCESLREAVLDEIAPDFDQFPAEDQRA